MKLCLGTVQFGIDYGVQGGRKNCKSEIFDILRFAIANGIDTFDTAPAYGNAEEVIGEFISAFKAPSIKVISKLGSDCIADVSPRDYKKTIAEEITKSCAALSMSKLDGYLLHDSRQLYDEDVLHVLGGLRDEGRIDNVGVSIYSPDDALLAANSEIIDFIQVPYNALDHRLERNGFFQLAKRNSKTVFVRSVFLQGLLTMDPDAFPDYVAHARDRARAFRMICTEAGYDLVDGCLAYVKNNKDIDYLVFGVNNLSQLNEIVRKFDNIDDVPESFIFRIREEFIDVDESIVNPALWKAG